MGRGKRNRGNNKPKHINGVRHHESCVCDRCLDVDAAKVMDAMQERNLEAEWEKFNKQHGITIAHIHLTVTESPVIGPYDGKDLSKALYVNCPPAIVGTIVPRSRRRK